jgi:hypothetical protein
MLFLTFWVYLDATQILLSPDLPPSQASARPSFEFKQNHRELGRDPAAAWQPPDGVGFRPTDPC